MLWFVSRTVHVYARRGAQQPQLEADSPLCLCERAEVDEPVWTAPRGTIHRCAHVFDDPSAQHSPHFYGTRGTSGRALGGDSGRSSRSPSQRRQRATAHKDEQK